MNIVSNISCENYLIDLEGGIVDLTVTSPPYDKLRSYNSVFDLDLIVRELFRVTKDGGVVVWIVADQTKNYNESGTSFRQALKFQEAGWCLYDTMIWVKSNYMPTGNRRYDDSFEYMFVFSKGKPKTFNPIKVPCVTAGKPQKWHHRPHESKVYKRNGVEERKTLEEKTKSNVWTFAVGGKNSCSDEVGKKHPAVFPEKLVRDHIHSWSNEGDLILDPFMGSGTTAKMASLMNRNWIGCDVDPECVAMTEERVALTKQGLF
ncbi:DNA-methyltransferase [Sanyastnella coralliicola]|uniref:DNA-methyltransferase n=1 Tax=Sanyastnella coralliicola TaxID=3069118 RepID=UPI0027BAFFD3|nr:site-specific DNA-methyltransferase [Longitalea sp. SCSIO 12813]